MRILLLILVILLSAGYIQAQEKETVINTPDHNPFDKYKELSTYNYSETSKLVDREAEKTNCVDAFVLESDGKKSPFKFVEVKRIVKEKGINEPDINDASPDKNLFQTKDKEKFHWKPALIQSGVFLGVQHGYRVVAQKGTRQQLAGPFFRDWAQSVKNLRGWRDGNRFFINYIGHPLQGGLTGRIFVNNSDRAKGQAFGKSKKYWETRLKAMAWSAVWSAQFELGPVSEANIGNVGLFPRGKYSSMAYVDLVVTPVVGTGVLVGEDAIDKYILKNWLERKGKNKTKIKILRSVLTPTTSIGNLLRGKVPWKRDDRSL